MPTPYGSSTDLPDFPGGVDDGDSLRVSGLTLSGNAWLPRLQAGRYAVSGESDFRYLYCAPRQASVTLGAGRSDVSVPLPSLCLSADTLSTAPVQVTLSGAPLTPVRNTVRWAVPVPSGSVCLAGGFVDPALLSDSLGPGDLLWYYRTGASDVLQVRRSRDPRSFDVLADADALLREVSSPDLLSDDRCYCFDRAAGIVYGRWPSEPLPPPPYGSGQWAATYLTLAGGGDPLLCEEVGYVDTDGAVRLRHAGPVGLNAVYVSPDGLLPLSVSGLGANVASVSAYDPGQGAYAALDYGATVLVDYYVRDSFCVTGVSASGSALVAGLSVQCGASGTASLTYEAEPGGLVTASSPNLNPLGSHVSSGFLYLEDPLDPVPVPASASATLAVSNPRPFYDADAGVGESVTVLASALDSGGVPISGAPLALTAPGYTVSPLSGVSGPDAAVLFTLTPASAPTGTVTLTLSDTRSGAVTSAVIDPQSSRSWEPSVLVCVAESYRYVAGAARRMVRAWAVQPDGFPWLRSQSPADDPPAGRPATIVLSSENSGFFDPDTDLPLGPRVTGVLGQGGVVSPEGVLGVGYAPAPGDVLRATLYAGDFRYDSDPLSV